MKFLFSVLICFSFLCSQSQIITTVTGNGIFGNTGDNGPALKAELGNPSDVDFDAAGNMYITDDNYNVIRKVNALTGVITTIAGNGTFGFSGDGGFATNAQLRDPISAAVDSAGNIYITDHSNFRIRRVDHLTNIIITVAGNGNDNFSGDGGLAINAGLRDPVGVAVDATGANIYIAEGSGNRIRKVNLLTGIITTIAGTGAQGYNGDGIAATTALLHTPYALAVDTAHSIYFTDFANNRIRKINASDGIIHTIAGNGTLGYTGDGGLAVNAEIGYSFGIALDTGNNILFSDWQFNYIRKINLRDSTISTVAGSGMFGYNGDSIPALQANLGQPYGIATHSNGDFYMADVAFSRIRKVSVNSVLPLKLVSFTVKKQSNSILLNWQTANELNAAYFNIQRSTDGRSFDDIDKVEARGSNKLQNDYAYVDNISQLHTDKLYYRLQEVDNDGKFNCSTIKIIDIRKNSILFTIFPNPTKDFINLISSGNVTNAQVSITNINGRTLYTATKSFNANQQIRIPATQFAKGVLLVTINANNNKQLFKVVKE